MNERQATPDARWWRAATVRLKARRSRLIAGAVAAVVVVALAGTAVGAADSQGSRYRTATAELGSVDETLALTGQVAAATSVSAAFQVAGTVADVRVALGDKVTAGQTLAALNTTDLQNAVTSAQNSVASAQQRLQDDLDAQSSAATSASSASAASSPRTGPTGSSNTQTPGAGKPDPAVTAAQAAVIAAQTALLAQYQAAVAATAAASTALDAAQKACAPFLSATLTTSGGTAVTPAALALKGTDPTATSTSGTVEPSVAPTVAPTSAAPTVAPPSATPTVTPTPTASTPAAPTVAPTSATPTATPTQATPTPTASTPAGPTDGPTSSGPTSTGQPPGSGQTGGDSLGDLLTQCQQALLTSLTAQQQTTAAQGTLTDRATELNNAISALTKALTTSSSTSTVTPANTTQTDGAGTQSQKLSGGSSTTVVTAEQILADQAAVDLANGKLALAQQDLSLANLSSPIDGTVVAIALASGDVVSARSTTAIITVQGSGYIVDVTVGLSKIAKVGIGQAATVDLPAFAASYPAQVSAIGVLNVSQTSDPSYTVTVALTTGGDTIRVGATAQTTISLASAADVLTVPTSAVTLTDTGATVVVLRAGQPTTVNVKVGAVDAERTEIVTGLSLGDTVVLADLDAAVTSNNDSDAGSLTNIGRRGNGFGGGTGGVGGGTGGFGGGTGGVGGGAGAGLPNR